MLQQDYLFEWRTILENAVLGAEIQGADMRRRPRARGAAAHPLRARPVPAPSAAPVVGRHAPARGAGAHALHRAGRRAARRAVLGARFADPHRAGRRGDRNPAPRGQDRDPGDARHRRGGQHGGARHRAVAPARAREVGPRHPLRQPPMDAARRRSRRATRPSSTAISTPSGRSSKSMSKVETSKVETAPAAGAHPEPAISRLAAAGAPHPPHHPRGATRDPGRVPGAVGGRCRARI